MTVNPTTPLTAIRLILTNYSDEKPVTSKEQELALLAFSSFYSLNIPIRFSIKGKNPKLIESEEVTDIFKQRFPLILDVWEKFTDSDLTVTFAGKKIPLLISELNKNVVLFSKKIPSFGVDKEKYCDFFTNTLSRLSFLNPNDVERALMHLVNCPLSRPSNKLEALSSLCVLLHLEATKAITHTFVQKWIVPKPEISTSEWLSFLNNNLEIKSLLFDFLNVYYPEVLPCTI